MSDYIDYAKTIKAMIMQIRKRLSPGELPKSTALFGLPLGLSKNSLDKYLSDLEDIILEGLFMHAFSTSERNIYNDLGTTLSVFETRRKSTYASKCSFDSLNLLKELSDFESLSKVIKFNEGKFGHISKYKKLRDYYAHGKRFPADETVNRIKIRDQIEEILKEIEI